MSNFYPYTSYPPHNTRTNMKRNYPRTKAAPIIFNKCFFAMVFFIAGFLLANHYTNSPQLKKCLTDSTINNDFCYKKFVG